MPNDGTDALLKIEFPRQEGRKASTFYIIFSKAFFLRKGVIKFADARRKIADYASSNDKI